jgi:hemolysin activation/secretion protein
MNNKVSNKVLMGLLAGAAMVCGAHGALAAVAAPASIEPSRTEQRYNQRDAHPALFSSPVVAPQAEAPLAQDHSSITFPLKSVTVVGATAFPAEQLQALAAEHVGKQVSLATLNAVAAKITAQYRNQGYILSKAIVPPQKVQGGAVTIQVIEGYVDDVVFQGGEKQNQSVLHGIAEKIKASRPLKNADLERYLLLVDDMVGIKARGVLSPSKVNAGSSTLTVALDYKKIEGDVSVDNRGSRFLGMWEGGVNVATNSLLGQSEQIRARTIQTLEFDELHYYELAYQHPVGSEGTVLRAQTSYTQTNPGAALEPFNIKGENVSFAIEGLHPLLRSRQENLYVGGGFRYRDASTDALSTELYDDHIRAVYANAAYDVMDRFNAVNRIDATLAQGLDVLDANGGRDNVSRANGENVFTKLNAQYTRLQPLNDNYSVFFGAAGQVSSEPLLASEEFTLGGVSYGSGYDPAELSGDNGYSARIEYRYSNDLPPAYGSMYQIYAFYDGGRVFNKDALVGESKTASLVSTGLGARFSLPQEVSLTTEVAKPLSQSVVAEGTHGEGVRGFVTLNKAF